MNLSTGISRGFYVHVRDHEGFKLCLPLDFGNNISIFYPSSMSVTSDRDLIILAQRCPN